MMHTRYDWRGFSTNEVEWLQKAKIGKAKFLAPLQFLFTIHGFVITSAATPVKKEKLGITASCAAEWPQQQFSDQQSWALEKWPENKQDERDLAILRLLMTDSTTVQPKPTTNLTLFWASHTHLHIFKRDTTMLKLFMTGSTSATVKIYHQPYSFLGISHTSPFKKKKRYHSAEVVYDRFYFYSSQNLPPTLFFFRHLTHISI